MRCTSAPYGSALHAEERERYSEAMPRKPLTGAEGTGASTPALNDAFLDDVGVGTGIAKFGVTADD